ncbi:MAG: enoyl-CoA hydratase/isomerase family protein [Bdellovibrionales bacterium]|nr:enoyl-CoA hydratase/isomerase family protein [Bdellovibrionales bacterium]
MHRFEQRFGMDFHSLRYELRNRVAYLTLNRPDLLNAFDRTLAAELLNALLEVEHNSEVRAVVITGAGRAFSAGQDLQELAQPDAPSAEEILRTRLNPLVRHIRSSRLPYVAALNGTAAGAGFTIASCCDILVAAETAFIVPAFVDVGLIPDGGGTYNIPRAVGRTRALSLFLLGERLSAVEACSLGLLSRVLPADTFEKEVCRIAEQLAEKAPVAIRLIKKAVHEAETNSFEEQLALEVTLQQEASLTDDHQEALRAFREKRPPYFRGK